MCVLVLLNGLVAINSRIVADLELTHFLAHLIVSLPEGGNREFTVPDGAVFHIDGEDKTVFDLREGMKFSATVLTVEPVHSITTHHQVAGQAPRPNVVFEGPILIEENREAPTMTASIEEQQIKELPRTASPVPLIGLLGFLSLALGTGLRIALRNTREKP